MKRTVLNPTHETPKPSALASCGCSAATWWVYYFDEGKKLYVTSIPLNLKRAQDMARAAQKYFRGRAVIQITETPPNAKLTPLPPSATVGGTETL